MSTRLIRSRHPAAALPSAHKKSPLPERRPKPQAKSLTATIGADIDIIPCPLLKVKFINEKVYRCVILNEVKDLSEGIAMPTRFFAYAQND